MAWLTLCRDRRASAVLEELREIRPRCSSSDGFAAFDLSDLNRYGWFRRAIVQGSNGKGNNGSPSGKEDGTR